MSLKVGLDVPGASHCKIASGRALAPTLMNTELLDEGAWGGLRSVRSMFWK